MPSAIDAAADSAELELLVVMHRRAASEQVEDVLARLASVGARGRVTPGRESTVIGAIGDRQLLASLGLEGFAGVQRVLPIQRPYKFVARESAPEPTVIQVRGRRIGGDHFGLIAGPCTVESREQTLETARAVADAGASMLRGVRAVLNRAGHGARLLVVGRRRAPSAGGARARAAG